MKRAHQLRNGKFCPHFSNKWNPQLKLIGFDSCRIGNAHVQTEDNVSADQQRNQPNDICSNKHPHANKRQRNERKVSAIASIKFGEFWNDITNKNSDDTT